MPAIDYVVTRFVQQNVGGLRRDMAYILGDMFLLESRIQQTQNVATRFVAIGAVTMGAVSSITKASLHAAGQVQRVELGYTTVLKSVEKAKQLSKEMREFDVKTPFSYLEVAQASQMLLAAGYRGKQLMDVMYGIGNATIAAGKGTDTFVRALAIMGKIKTSGILNAVRVNQFAAAGINIKEILKKQLGLTDEQMINIGRLHLKADVVIPALIKGLNEQFGGAIERAREGYLGSLEVLKGQTDKLLASIGKAIMPDATRALNQISDIVQSMDKFTAAHPKFVKAVLTGVMAGSIISIIYGAKKAYEFFDLSKKALLVTTGKSIAAEGAKAAVAGREGRAIRGVATAASAATVSKKALTAATQAGLNANEKYVSTLVKLQKIEDNIYRQSLNISRQTRIASTARVGKPKWANAIDAANLARDTKANLVDARRTLQAELKAIETAAEAAQKSATTAPGRLALAKAGALSTFAGLRNWSSRPIMTGASSMIPVMDPARRFAISQRGIITDLVRNRTITQAEFNAYLDMYETAAKRAYGIGSVFGKVSRGAAAAAGLEGLFAGMGVSEDLQMSGLRSDQANFYAVVAGLGIAAASLAAAPLAITAAIAGGFRLAINELHNKPMEEKAEKGDPGPTDTPEKMRRHLEKSLDERANEYFDQAEEQIKEREKLLNKGILDWRASDAARIAELDAQIAANTSAAQTLLNKAQQERSTRAAIDKAAETKRIQDELNEKMREQKLRDWLLYDDPTLTPIKRIDEDQMRGLKMLNPRRLDLAAKGLYDKNGLGNVRPEDIVRNSNPAFMQYASDTARTQREKDRRALAAQYNKDPDYYTPGSGVRTVTRRKGQLRYGADTMRIEHEITLPPREADRAVNKQKLRSYSPVPAYGS